MSLTNKPEENLVNMADTILAPSKFRGQDDDVALRIVRDRAIGRDRYAVATGERLEGGRHDTHAKQRGGGFFPHQRLPDIARGQQHIEHAVERGARGLGHGNDQDFDGAFVFGGHRGGSC